MHTVEVEHGDAAELSHRDREIDVDHAVHGRAPKRKWKAEALTHRKGNVDLFGIKGHTAGDKRDLVETVSAARTAADPDLEILTNSEASP
jgi:hypothetical protein